MSNALKTKTVDMICQRLSERIQAGEFDVQGRLPSERVLSEQFRTTRITLREALSQLESHGQIYRELRRGWFIAPPRLIYNPLHRSHFHAMASRQGRTAQTKVIDAQRVHLDRVQAENLALQQGDDAYCIRRIRYIDYRPVLYVEHYLNPAYFPGLLDFDLTTSLTDLYADHYGIRYGHVRFTMLPCPLPAFASPALKVATSSPALFITRINRDQHHRIIDCDCEYWRYDALCIDVEA